MSYRQEDGRFHELDALRGLAAFLVVIMHFHDLLFGKDRRLHFSHTKLLLLYLASPFRSGESAVTLFFVLSGFVLALPILAGKTVPYGMYALRRIVRIHLPYLPALGLAVAGDAMYHGQIPQGMWTIVPWRAPPTATLVLQHVLLLGSFDNLAFNFVFWTLVIEMRVSLIYPFLVKLLLQRRSETALVLNLLVLCALTILALRFPDADLLKTARFGCFFLVGLQIARQREQAGDWFRRLPTYGRTLLLIVSALGFGYNIALRAPTPISDLICLASSVGIIVISLNNTKLRTLLRRRGFQWLGQISYSLYLTHLPALFLLYLWVGKRGSNLIFLLIYISCALLFATLFYYGIERTSLLLSRWIGKHRAT